MEFFFILPSLPCIFLSSFSSSAFQGFHKDGEADPASTEECDRPETLGYEKYRQSVTAVFLDKNFEMSMPQSLRVYKTQNGCKFNINLDAGTRRGS
jgi:hypothetical protein